MAASFRAFVRDGILLPFSQWDTRQASVISSFAAMSTIRRFWLPVLVAALVGALGAVLVIGPLGERGEAQAVVEPRVTIRTITLPAAAFNPTSDNWDFDNLGYNLHSNLWGGNFATPLFFEAPEVTIRRITLYALDNGGEDMCVYLRRSTPAVGGEDDMGQVCSSGAGTAVRAFIQTTFAHRRITGAYGPYLWLYLPNTEAAGYEFYGVKSTDAY